jgi:hypothetical protein
MMKPAEKIDSIRIHQINGFSGAPGSAPSNGDAGQKTPINQVMDSILGMALQLPALRSIGDSIGLDFASTINSPTTAVAERKAGNEPDRSKK